MQRVKKSEIITLRVTPRVKEAIRERARAAGLTVTDYLCYSGLGKEIVRMEGLEQVLSELKAQGRNLNQLTTLANMGKIQEVRFGETMEALGRIYHQLRELTEQDGQQLSDVICYAVNSEKTQETGSEDGTPLHRFVSGINCSPATARDEMLAVIKRFGIESGTVTYHG